MATSTYSKIESAPLVVAGMQPGLHAGSRRLASAIWYALRPHQWIKNLLLLVPLVTSHRLADPGVMGHACLAILSFSLCASAVYVCNDLLDLDSDRRHPRKRLRPFASGALSVRAGFLLIPALLAGAFVSAARLPYSFQGLLGIYALSSSVYSFYLKRIPLVDVFALSGLYTLRLLAGHFAAGIQLSQWLLSFSMLVFLSLALDKRVSELFNLRAAHRYESHGRGYYAGDLENLGVISMGSGFSAMLVLSFYLDSARVRTLYRQPMLLWLIFPLLLYWVTRLAFLARRGAVDEDPIVFVAKDRTTYAVAAAVALVLICATFGLAPDWMRPEW